MQNISHSRKTSLHQKAYIEDMQSDINQHQLCFAKSAKDSPQESHLHWLRSTHFVHIGRIHSDEKSKERIREQLGYVRQEKRKPWQLINVKNIAKLKPLSTMTNVCLESALYIIQTSIKEYTSLPPSIPSPSPSCSPSSPSSLPHFNIKNCYINKTNELIIKFYTNSHLKTQINIYEQSHVVRDIIESVHKICTPHVFDDFYAYYRRAAIKKLCDFKYTLSLVKSYCCCAKVCVGSKIVQSLGQQDVKIEKKESQNPKSIQKISPFVLQMITSKVTRIRSSKKTHRQSFHMNLFDSRTKQKQLKGITQNQSQRTPITPVQKSVVQKHPQKIPQIFVPTLTPSSGMQTTHKISIQPQFNILLSPKASQHAQMLANATNNHNHHQQQQHHHQNVQIDVSTFNNSCNYNMYSTSINKNDTKDSTVSTNFNSSLHNMDIQSSTIYLKSKPSVPQPQIKQHFSFLPPDLDQVQSLGESSDQESQLPTRRFETPRDIHLENIKKQNQNRILTINNWTRKVEGLLEEDRDIKESICEDWGKENEGKAMRRNGSENREGENLKRMVRAVVESVLPGPSQFHIKYY